MHNMLLQVVKDMRLGEQYPRHVPGILYLVIDFRATVCYIEIRMGERALLTLWSIKERIGRLNKYQKGLLLILAAMVIVFSVLYPVTISRVGFEYNDKIFVPEQADGVTVYSGRIGGEQASFTVSEDKTVEFSCGGSYYGPYTVREAPDAVPEDMRSEPDVTGVELFESGELIFRGAVDRFGDRFVLRNEDGSMPGASISVTYSDGTVYDGDGNLVDPLEPDVYTVIELMYGPELTHKGEGLVWFGGVLLCVITACSILFADELFRWNLSFSIRNADRAEPTDWEIMTRYISWTVLPIMALVIFIIGLR